MAARESGLAARSSVESQTRGRAFAKPQYGEPPLSELEFPDCYVRPVTLEEGRGRCGSAP